MGGLKAPAKSRWLPLVLALAAGMLLAASFPKINIRWLAWLAPGLILWIADAPTGKRVLCRGFLAGWGNYLVSLYWLLRIPFPWHALAGYLAMCAVLSCFMAIWCWVCWRALPRSNRVLRVAWPFGCAAAWVAMEMILARFLGGFPWNFLGDSQVHFLSLIQVASIAGIYGVSFLVAWVSVALVTAARALVKEKRSTGAMVIQLVPALVVTMCAILWGAMRLSRPEVEGATLKIALIQPSIPQRVYWDPAEKTNRFMKLIELSRAVMQARPPDLIVWPEAVMPDIFTRNGYLQSNIVSLLQLHPAWMVLGATDTAPKPGASDPSAVDHFNAAFLINPKGELVDRYYKRHLVPFGEYMPGAGALPILGKLRSAGAGITPGRRTSAFQIGNPPVRFPVTICFEDLFPHEVRRRVDVDTDFILNLTSDAWFGETAAQWQHAESAALRAVENGVPLVRCCNNGLTCWVDARGRIYHRKFLSAHTIYETGIMIAEIPLQTGTHRIERTIYNRVGDLFGWSCVALVLLGGGFTFSRDRFAIAVAMRRG